MNQTVANLFRTMYEIPVIYHCDYCKAGNALTNRECVKCGAPDWCSENIHIYGNEYKERDVQVDYLDIYIETDLVAACFARGMLWSSTSRYSYHAFFRGHGCLLQRGHKHFEKIHLIIPPMLYAATRTDSERIFGPDNNISIFSSVVDKIWITDHIKTEGWIVPWMLSAKVPSVTIGLSNIDDVYYFDGSSPG